MRFFFVVNNGIFSPKTVLCWLWYISFLECPCFEKDGVCDEGNGTCVCTEGKYGFNCNKGKHKKQGHIVFQNWLFVNNQHYYQLN